MSYDRLLVLPAALALILLSAPQNAIAQSTESTTTRTYSVTIHLQGDTTRAIVTDGGREWRLVKLATVEASPVDDSPEFSQYNSASPVMITGSHCRRIPNGNRPDSHDRLIVAR